eukprot:6194676-Pleurochrysis_carterae.AAC.4
MRNGSTTSCITRLKRKATGGRPCDPHAPRSAPASESTARALAWALAAAAVAAVDLAWSVALASAFAARRALATAAWPCMQAIKSGVRPYSSVALTSTPA